MPTIRERIRSWLGFEIRAPKTQAPYSRGASNTRSLQWGVLDARRSATTLRRFSETNTWVRVAINRRKREIGKAKWSIHRIDDPKAPPNEKLVAQVTDLFTFVNPKRESLRSLLDMVVEDILVLDAGCVEKEKTAGGEIIALWAVDGGTIKPSSKWDGSNPKAPRYTQIIDGKEIAQLLNDELVYIMANPRSNSPIGLSPLEVLFQVVEAELYGEDFEYQLMRETAPAGMINLGKGIEPGQVEAFRDLWTNEIAGTRDMAIVGGGEGDIEYTPFTRSAREEQRREYMKWLATKVAAAFEMDLMAFNLTENIHRSVGQNAQAKTDEGLIGLATLIQEYITREILWEMDPLHQHGFQFDDLTARDELQQANLDKIAMSIGVTTPNEIRAREGMDPFPGSMQGDTPDTEHWANLPYPFNNNTAAQPEEDPLDGKPADGAPGADGEDDQDGDGGNQQQTDDDGKPDGGAKNGSVPFVRRVPPTRRTKAGYLTA